MSVFTKATMLVHGGKDLRVLETMSRKLKVAAASRSAVPQLCGLIGAEPACYLLLGTTQEGELIGGRDPRLSWPHSFAPDRP